MKQLTVLAVGPYWPAGSFRFLTEALEHANIRVFRVGPMFLDHGGVSWDVSDFPTIHVPLGKNVAWDVPYYVDLCTKQIGAPDFIFYSEESYSNQIIPKQDIPSALWSLDGWPQNFGRIQMFKATKGYMNHPFGIRLHPRIFEDERWEFMPGAAAPWVHWNYQIERDIDFVLLASMYGYRPHLVQGLQALGYATVSGFHKTDRFVTFHNRGLFTYHNANLQEEVKVRFFEAAAMGTCIISDHTRLLHRLGYEPWIHYIPCPIDVRSILENPQWHEAWPSVETMKEILDYGLDNKQHIATIARQCRDKVLSQDTYYHRAATMLAGLESGMVRSQHYASLLELARGFIYKRNT